VPVFEFVPDTKILFTRTQKNDYKGRPVILVSWRF